MKVTVHHFTKTNKPISVDGKSFGTAFKQNSVWSVCDKTGKEIFKVDSVRAIEFAVLSHLS